MHVDGIFWLTGITPIDEEYVELVTERVCLERTYVIATYRRPGDGRRVRYRFARRSDN